MSDETLLRISSIQVEGLFDRFDHQVDLKLDDRVTILHGPNGVGKTMLLRMVSDLLIGRYGLFVQIPFRRFALTLTDGSEIDLTSKHHQDHTSAGPSKLLKLSLLENGRQKETYEFSSSQDILSRVEKAVRQLPCGENEWFDETNSSLMTTEQLVELYADEMYPGKSEHLRARLEPEWLKVLRDRVAAHLIKEQRLLRLSTARPDGHRSIPRNVCTVLDYASNLHTSINDTMARYGRQSQRLDQSFPQRLLTSLPPTLSADDLKARMKELDVMQAELIEIGLLDKPEDHPFGPATLDSLDPASRSVMGFYVQDTSEKLDVLTPSCPPYPPISGQRQPQVPAQADPNRSRGWFGRRA